MFVRNNVSLYLILIIISLFCIQPVYASNIILDNNQPGTDSTGTWSPSAGLNFYGTQSLYSRDVDATYSYTIQIPEPGTYDVNLWWTEYISRSTNVAIDITHGDGTTRVYVNQKQNGGQWNTIGSWYFATDAIVTLHSDPANNSTNTDAVQLTAIASGEDEGNSAPVIHGFPANVVTIETAYRFIPDADDADGDNLIFNIRNQPDWANFNSSTGALTGTPSLGDAGTTQAILISVSDGLRTTSLAAFNLTVTQANVLDNNQPGTVASGTWLPSGGADSYGTQSLYSREVGATYSYTIPVPAPGSYDVSLWWTEFHNRSARVAVSINGSDWVYIDQTKNGGQWNKIGSWYFATDAIITVHSNSTDKSTNVDAVQLVANFLSSSLPNHYHPRISGVPSTAITVGTAYRFTPSVFDRHGSNLIFNISNPPGWASFNSSTGELTGTPNDGDEGTTENILISVSDGIQTTSLKAFNLTVSKKSSRSPVERIVDNDEPGTVATGNWYRSGGADSYGTQSLYSREVGATYRYTIPISAPSTYDVNLWWTEFRSRSTNVAIDIKHRDGTARVYVNQKQNGGQWNKIGSWYFATDAIVTIHSDSTNKSTNADAVHLVVARDGNSAPTIGGVPASTATVETVYRFIPSVNDADGGNLTFNINNQPGWASFNTNTGALTGIPANGDEGTTKNILISVNDGLQTASLAVFDITVERPRVMSAQIIDPTPGNGNKFGDRVFILANGNVVITDPGDSSVAPNNGAFHLYNPSTQTFIASFYGDAADDWLRIIAIENGNFIISSRQNDVRLINGTTGAQIGATLAGSQEYRQPIIAHLASGNFIIATPWDDNGGRVNVGLVRLINGTTGLQISAIIGNTADDQLGSGGITSLANGNFIIATPWGDNGGKVDVGSVRLINGTTGLQVSAIIGDTASDRLGSGGITSLENSNFVIRSPDEDGMLNGGSTRLINGSTGTQISIFTGDSGLGPHISFFFGGETSGVETTALTNSNFVIHSIHRDERITPAPKYYYSSSYVYSARLINGTTGVQIGPTLLSQVIYDEFDEGSEFNLMPHVTALKNNNFLFEIPSYNSLRLIDGNTGMQIGARLFGYSAHGSRATLADDNFFLLFSPENPYESRLMSGFTGTQIGPFFPSQSRFTILKNRNVVIASSNSVRLMNGVTGTPIGTTLIGDTEHDQLGFVTRGLINNNFVIGSHYRNEGGIVQTGSVRLIDGTTGAQISTRIINQDTTKLSVTESPKGDFYIIAAPYADNHGLVESGQVRLMVQ